MTDQPDHPDHTVPTPGAHLGLDALADLQEGLLGAATEEIAQAHLGTCPACRADRQALADLPGRLAAAGDVGPVPTDLAARLQDALESASRPATAAVTVTPLDERRVGRESHAPRGMRALQAAAVLVVLLAGGAIGVSALQNNGTEQDGAAQSDAGADTSGGGAERSAADTFPVLATGTDYTAGSVPSAVPLLLDAPASASADGGDSALPTSGTASSAAPAALSALSDRAALAACVLNLTDGKQVTPVGVDLAAYDGEPAAVLALPADNPAKIDVYVVEPGCPTGTFLYFERVARP